MTKPLIGLLGRRKKGRDVAGVPDPLAEVDVDLYFSDYARGVLEAGGLPVHLPVDAEAAELVDRLDGILLTGGTDIDPTRYGAEPHPDQFEPEPGRDELEFSLLDLAIAGDVPVLGICRGLQVVNVFDGGTLNQHVAVHARFDLPPHAEEHAVELEDGSILHRLYGPTRRVNSLHHQTVDRPGPNLNVTAVADDGVVEGLEHRSASVLAVQWHPEMMTTRSTDPVFGWLVEEAAARMAA